MIEPVCLGLLLTLLFAFRSEIETMELQDIARLTTLVGCVMTAVLVRSAPKRLWSPSTLYFITLLVFHCGLAAVLAVGEVDLQTFSALRYWLYRDTTRSAMWLTTIGFTAFACGARLAHLQLPQRFRRSSVEDDANTLMAFAALVIMSASLVLWFAVALASGGFGILIGSYTDFLSMTGDSVMPYAYYGINLGMVLVAAARWTRWHRIIIGGFVCWSVLAFPLGLRGEILFPLVAALAVVAARRKVLSGTKTAVLAIALLSAISAARQVRSVGVSTASVTDVSFSPVDGLVELGSSLRPVSEVVLWHRTGYKLAQGGTYWAPIDRALYYLIPGWTRIPAELDERLMSIVVMDRVGPIGFSPIAESYYNFGPYGVLAIMMLFGFILGRVDTWPDTRFHQAAAGIIMVGLLSHVRNSFVPVPAQIFVGFLGIGAIVMIARLSERRGLSR